MQKQNRSLPKFSNPLWETSSEAERGKERQVFIGKRQTIGDWREREKREIGSSVLLPRLASIPALSRARN